MKKTCAIILIGCLSLACRLGAQHEEALRQIAAQESAGNLRGAIASIETALKAAPGAEALVLRLRELNKKFYLDSAPPSSDDAYKVRAGDTLTSIARAHSLNSCTRTRSRVAGVQSTSSAARPRWLARAASPGRAS